MFRLTRFADCPAFDQRPGEVVDANLGGFHFSRQPFGIADGKLPITVPKAERYPPCGLKHQSPQYRGCGMTSKVTVWAFGSDGMIYLSVLFACLLVRLRFGSRGEPE